jgi:hypothetical protein
VQLYTSDMISRSKQGKEDYVLQRHR